MVSLNMSQLNLSSVRSQPLESETKSVSEAEAKFDAISIQDPDDEFHCEYREDIWQHLLQQEKDKPEIHLQSPQLEFRGALIQQLRDINKKLGLSIATLHSAASLLDQFMDAHRLRADRLTHVALACLSLAGTVQRILSIATLHSAASLLDQFMDAHRLTHVALAYLSLAAKSEEKFSRAPTLKTLSKVSNVQLCGKTFRQLEWMVGQHVRWRLLAPTPVTFAALLAQYVVTDGDLTTRHPKFVRRFKRDGAKFLDAYLDLTLSNVRLKVVESVEVGCACVACARAELGLPAWPAWVARATARPAGHVTPVARLLHKMMQMLKSRDTPAESETDQGYGSAKTSPNQTPSTSPLQVSPASSTCSTSTRSYVNVDTSYRQQPIQSMYSVLDLNTGLNARDYLPAIDMTLRIDNPDDYSYFKSRRLIDASLEGQPSTSRAVKRGLESNVDLDRKRYRLTQMSQVVQ